jgi:hypothetical protein
MGTAKEMSKAHLGFELNRFLALSVQRVIRNLSIVDSRHAVVMFEEYRGKSYLQSRNTMEQNQLH